MSKIILVCGQTGAGKTTYSIDLSKSLKAVRFSIDYWMQTLFSKDMKTLDFSWIMERVTRCQHQIWEVSKQVIANKGSVVLDLAFTTKEQRSIFVEEAKKLGGIAEIHYLDTPVNIRRQRIAKRNANKDPALYSFEVTNQMFDFMEPRFERPDEIELKNGKTISIVESKYL